MPNKVPPIGQRFKKGNTISRDFHAKLTAEEKAARSLAFREKRSMKKAFQETIEQNQAKWIALFNNRMAELLPDANAQEIAVLFDRVIGKPTETIEQDINAKIENITVDFIEVEEDDNSE